MGCKSLSHNDLEAPRFVATHSKGVGVALMADLHQLAACRNEAIYGRLEQVCSSFWEAIRRT
jgi:hypothetical protein